MSCSRTVRSEGAEFYLKNLFDRRVYTLEARLLIEFTAMQTVRSGKHG
jgi:hypothetical protein